MIRVSKLLKGDYTFTPRPTYGPPEGPPGSPQGSNRVSYWIYIRKFEGWRWVVQICGTNFHKYLIRFNFNPLYTEGSRIRLDFIRFKSNDLLYRFFCRTSSNKRRVLKTSISHVLGPSKISVKISLNINNNDKMRANSCKTLKYAHYILLMLFLSCLKQR